LLVAVLGVTPFGNAAYNAVVPQNSVGAQQLRNGAVTDVKIRGDAVDSGKVRNRSLKAIDFALGQIPTGAVGAKGDKGDKGDKGSPGLAGVEVVRGTVTIPPKSYGGTTADCAAGRAVLGGGINTSNGLVIPTTSRPLTARWEGRAYNSDTVARLIEVYAVCATVAG
jgi:hypothetical protein